MIAFFVVGCSKGPSQLSFDKIEGLPLDEQVNAIVENTKLVEDHEIIVDDNSVAIIYPAEFISDDRLTLDKSKESFPSVAMVFAEHLKVLDVDEIVITSYDPSTELTKVSALFTSE